MILSKIQAEMIQSAMVSLSCIGGLLNARNILCGAKDCQVVENVNGQIVISTIFEVIETYSNKDTFAEAYELEL